MNNEQMRKRENSFIMFSSIIAIILIAVTLWLLNQPSCWSKYTNERDAIANCEGKL